MLLQGSVAFLRMVVSRAEISLASCRVVPYYYYVANRGNRGDGRAGNGDLAGWWGYASRRRQKIKAAKAYTLTKQ